jgi:alkanesulfonate monooxygenase SsuD/methylene tetrahydromethanopterin reductase-like flavin-dependent oxidoreductase (luciferase family)
MPGVWFGVMLPQLRMSYATILERTLAAEAAGVDSVWLIDHMAAPAAPEVDYLEAWTTATALATQTDRIRIGHLVLCDTFRHPALLAKMASTLDVLSGGRLDLGIGWGSVPEELSAYGFGDRPPAERSARLRETLEILQLMFAGERFDHDGAHYQLRGALGRPTPIQEPIPIHIGGGGPKLTMPLVRDFAQWWNCTSYAVDRLDDLRPLAGGARISIEHPIGLAPDDASRDEVVALTQRRFGAWGGLVTGTASEVTDVLLGEVERGVEGFVFQFHDFGTPATVERFMSDVAPAVRAAAG